MRDTRRFLPSPKLKQMRKAPSDESIQQLRERVAAEPSDLSRATSLASLYTNAAMLALLFPSLSVPEKVQDGASRLRACSLRFSGSSACATPLDVCVVQRRTTSRRTPIPVRLQSLHHCIPSLPSSDLQPGSYQPIRPNTPNLSVSEHAPQSRPVRPISGIFYRHRPTDPIVARIQISAFDSAAPTGTFPSMLRAFQPRPAKNLSCAGRINGSAVPRVSSILHED